MNRTHNLRKTLKFSKKRASIYHLVNGTNVVEFHFFEYLGTFSLTLASELKIWNDESWSYRFSSIVYLFCTDLDLLTCNSVIRDILHLCIWNPSTALFCKYSFNMMILQHYIYNYNNACVIYKKKRIIYRKRKRRIKKVFRFVRRILISFICIDMSLKLIVYMSLFSSWQILVNVYRSVQTVIEMK